MSDKPRQLGERAGKRIDLSQESECRFWSDKFGVSADRLRKIVRKVGPMVKDVEKHLRDRTKKARKA
jgi:hypothetical protein